jgi:hypothetical protein
MMEFGDQAAAFQPEVLFERGFETDLAEAGERDCTAELMIIFALRLRGVQIFADRVLL